MSNLFFHVDKPNCLRKNEASVAKKSNILFTSVIILSSIAFIMALFYVCILCKTQNKAIHNTNQQISISAHQRHINLYEIINIWCELGWVNIGCVAEVKLFPINEKKWFSIITPSSLAKCPIRSLSSTPWRI